MWTITRLVRKYAQRVNATSVRNHFLSQLLASNICRLICSHPLQTASSGSGWVCHQQWRRSRWTPTMLKWAFSNRLFYSNRKLNSSVNNKILTPFTDSKCWFHCSKIVYRFVWCISLSVRAKITCLRQKLTFIYTFMFSECHDHCFIKFWA